VAPDILNPFHVVVNAEMVFRRFKRHPHPLCDEYTEFVDLTISFVKKIYLQLLVYKIDMERAEFRVQFAKGSEDKSGAKLLTTKSKP